MNVISFECCVFVFKNHYSASQEKSTKGLCTRPVEHIACEMYSTCMATKREKKNNIHTIPVPLGPLCSHSRQHTSIPRPLPLVRRTPSFEVLHYLLSTFVSDFVHSKITFCTFWPSVWCSRWSPSSASTFDEFWKSIKYQLLLFFFFSYYSVAIRAPSSSVYPISIPM